MMTRSIRTFAALLAAISLCFCWLTTASALDAEDPELVSIGTGETTVLLGDVNGDGRVTSPDARLALRAAARLIALTPEQSAVADYDRDGNITSADARYILRVAARLDPFASAEPTDPPQTTEPSEPLQPEERQFVYAPVDGFSVRYGKSAAIYDLDNDRILYGKDLDAAIEPASTTKLMTAYVASKYLAEDDIITVGSELGLVNGNASVANIYQGLRMTFSEMLKCLLLPSGCDAAYAIAAAAAKAYTGDPYMSASSAVETFISLMNAEAQRMGMTNTTWTNPDGFPNYDRPYTTARDMIVCGTYAYSVPVIRDTMKMIYATVYTAEGYEFASFTNTNELLNPYNDHYYVYCVGMKTGSHSTAGQCLVTAAEKDGRTFVAVVFGCSDKEERYYALMSMYETAFAYYM